MSQSNTDRSPAHPATGRLLLVRVPDDSLWPRLPQGAQAVVDPCADRSPGDLLYVMTDAGPTFRRLDRRRGRYLLATLDGAPPVPLTDLRALLGVVVAAQYAPGAPFPFARPGARRLA